MNSVFILLIIYQIKHFICDYPLQGKFMLGKFLPFPKFILPLTAHALVHGIATYLIALCFKPQLAIALGSLDIVLHFIVDRLKASPTLGGRWKPLTKDTYIAAVQSNDQAALKGNIYFWWALGADQMAHHLTHYLIIWMLVR